MIWKAWLVALTVFVVSLTVWIHKELLSGVNAALGITTEDGDALGIKDE